MNIKCPKCLTVNPPSKIKMYEHYYENCRVVVERKKILFGLFTKKVYCNHFLAFDDEDDYIKEGDERFKQKGIFDYDFNPLAKVLKA